MLRYTLVRQEVPESTPEKLVARLGHQPKPWKAESRKPAHRDGTSHICTIDKKGRRLSALVIFKLPA
ncbi:hypothetical protein [Hydrococcus rivularis]|uniref:hypothetical protein n=1 Tax=Hydrococcus rivularis TaxID=1616834 RepID=UPI001114C613|nr:hypothetical protein [Hydrococcus rivularis]